MSFCVGTAEAGPEREQCADAHADLQLQVTKQCMSG